MWALSIPGAVPRPPATGTVCLQISGVWYSIFMASDDLNRIKENGDLRVFVRNIEHLKNGSLKFDFEFMCVLPVSAGIRKTHAPATPTHTLTLAHTGSHTQTHTLARA